MLKKLPIIGLIIGGVIAFFKMRKKKEEPMAHEAMPQEPMPTDTPQTS
jgi:hypothetical protein